MLIQIAARQRRIESHADHRIIALQSSGLQGFNSLIYTPVLYKLYKLLQIKPATQPIYRYRLMESSKNKQHAVEEASGSKQPAAACRAHWRRRDPADTAVYVVQPDQFRAVVQQLTGAASSPPPAHQHRQGGHGTAAAAQQQHQPTAATGTCTNAAPQHGGGRTLGQIQQECMAWANSDD